MRRQSSSRTRGCQGPFRTESTRSAQTRHKAAIAEAEKVVAAAKGKADANRILQQSITPELIQLKAVEKWDGKLPLSTGGNTLPFLKLQWQSLWDPIGNLILLGRYWLCARIITNKSSGKPSISLFAKIYSSDTCWIIVRQPLNYRPTIVGR